MLTAHASERCAQRGIKQDVVDLCLRKGHRLEPCKTVYGGVTVITSADHAVVVTTYCNRKQDSRKQDVREQDVRKLDVRKLAVRELEDEARIRKERIQAHLQTEGHRISQAKKYRRQGSPACRKSKHGWWME